MKKWLRCWLKLVLPPKSLFWAHYSLGSHIPGHGISAWYSLSLTLSFWIKDLLVFELPLLCVIHLVEAGCACCFIWKSSVPCCYVLIKFLPCRQKESLYPFGECGLTVSSFGHQAHWLDKMLIHWMMNLSNKEITGMIMLSLACQ